MTHSNTRKLLSKVGATAAASIMFAAAIPASGAEMYSSIPATLPGNVPSVGFEATSASEFGDRVKFAVGSGGRVKSVTVVMSSWGCESGHWYSGDCLTTSGATFSHPITLKLYADGAPNPGLSLATTTQTFAIPYRPSADPLNCTGANAGKWYNAAELTCYNGFATEVTFVLPGAGVAVPSDTVVWGVAYNTTHYGSAPIGESAACYTASGGCGYDSLNVGLNTSPPLVGTDVDPNGVYWNTSYALNYCDGGAGGVNTFRLDDGCWAPYVPMAEFIGATANDCKKEGWQSFTNPTFKNQGACVSYFEHLKH